MVTLNTKPPIELATTTMLLARFSDSFRAKSFQAVCFGAAFLSGAVSIMGNPRLHWGYIGTMENKMETTIMGLYRV